MSHNLRARMTYANVVSSLALFLVVSGGTAIAAATITGADVVDESLTGVDIQNASLQSADVSNGSLTGLDVADGTIGTADVVNSSLTGTDVMDGSILSTDIGNGAVTGADLTDGGVDSVDIKNGGVSTYDLRDAGITALDLSAGSVQKNHVKDRNLTGLDIADRTLGTRQITTTDLTHSGLTWPLFEEPAPSEAKAQCAMSRDIYHPGARLGDLALATLPEGGWFFFPNANVIRDDWIVINLCAQRTDSSWGPSTVRVVTIGLGH